MSVKQVVRWEGHLIYGPVFTHGDKSSKRNATFIKVIFADYKE
jgi:hypothetical protein